MNRESEPVDDVLKEVFEKFYRLIEEHQIEITNWVETLKQINKCTDPIELKGLVNKEKTMWRAFGKLDEIYTSWAILKTSTLYPIHHFIFDSLEIVRKTFFYKEK